MGYTAQLMAGAWVGCDVRFIHFDKDNLNGQGSRAAMPIWAYFYSKAVKDPNCGLEPKQTFVKPDVMSNDLIIDYINGNTPVLGGEEKTWVPVNRKMMKYPKTSNRKT